ncbi:MAG: MlaD family protein [Prevotella sp.]|nr:MlaD family protein [Prevotella sp.]MCI6308308.1 MlaD family protein [Prevotella sp.]MCI7285009.1 MlaD family protein [Prevotella sp.]MDY5926685.1 MlaD family protein [Prevotella sp.]MEE1205126.1 MlaD family protein [Prevotella sp.]
MKYFTKEVKIALVAIAGVVVLFFGMNFLKGLNIFSSEDNYYVQFSDITGLSSSSPVYADGFKVGVVKDIIYDYSHTEGSKVLIGVDKQLRIPQGSSAEIVSDMLGNVKVNLLLANNPREKVAPGGLIKGMINDGAMGKLQDMVPAVEKMLPKLDSIMTSLNAILADPAIRQSLHNVQAITDNLTTSTAQLNTLMAGLNKNVPGMMAKANNVLDNTETLTANLAAVDVASTMRQVDQTIANVQQLTAKLNSKEGSLGLLMNDTQLYDNLNSTMRNADSLVIDLRQHPKRYVHFSVFGRKDK